MFVTQAALNKSTDQTEWLKAVKNHEGGLESLSAFITDMQNIAKQEAMKPTITETEWRATQTYYKFCEDFKIRIGNDLAEMRMSEDRESYKEEGANNGLVE